MRTKSGKVPVSERALIQRINRCLNKSDEYIKKARGVAVNTIGQFYRVDFYSNAVIERDVDIEELGRKIGALQGYEELKG